MKFNPITLFFLAPLIYSIDGDPYRTYEVLAAAGLFLAIFMKRNFHKTHTLDIISIFLFSGFLIIQQFFIRAGDLIFGINFFVTFIAAFLPFWLLRSVHWHYPSLESGLLNGINLLFWIAFLMISLSYFTGIGERYSGGIAGYRAFGFLGDSFSAVMVFFFLFYMINGSKNRTFISGIVILMMGAKAAIVMVIFCMALYFTFIKKSAIHKFFGVAQVICLASIPFGFDWLMSNLQNLEFSMMNRLLSYGIGIQYFLESPIFGIGINGGLLRTSDEAAVLAESLGIANYFPVYQVQNPYLRILSETGLIGFFLLMTFVYFLVRQSIRSIKSAMIFPDSTERSIIFAASLWTIGFVSVYQTTGWFLAGHPQLTWLLMFSSISIILVERKVRWS